MIQSGVGVYGHDDIKMSKALDGYWSQLLELLHVLWYRYPSRPAFMAPEYAALQHLRRK